MFCLLVLEPCTYCMCLLCCCFFCVRLATNRNHILLIVYHIVSYKQIRRICTSICTYTLFLLVTRSNINGVVADVVRTSGPKRWDGKRTATWEGDTCDGMYYIINDIRTVRIGFSRCSWPILLWNICLVYSIYTLCEIAKRVPDDNSSFCFCFVECVVESYSSVLFLFIHIPVRTAKRIPH